jgi:hypothetical protein
MRTSTFGRWVARLALAAAIGVSALAGSTAVLGSQSLAQVADISWQMASDAGAYADDVSWQ